MSTDYIVSIKEKSSGKDVLKPFVLSRLERLDLLISRATMRGLIVIVDGIDSTPTITSDLLDTLFDDNYGKKE